MCLLLKERDHLIFLREYFLVLHLTLARTSSVSQPKMNSGSKFITEVKCSGIRM